MARQGALQIALSKIKLQPPDVEWVAHDSSVEKHSQERAAQPGRHSTSLRAGSPLRSPGFPVESSGVDQNHAVFLKENRTRGVTSSAK
jgi:hypothetical protein